MTATSNDNAEKSQQEGSNPSPTITWLDDSHIDPDWVERELGLVGCTSCEATDMSNQMRVGARVRDGATLHLTLTYSNDDDDNESKHRPKTLVVKQTATEQGRALARQLGLAREALFYKNLAPHISAAQDKKDDNATTTSTQHDVLPKIYYSSGDMALGHKCVVMEDLKDTTVDSGILFGPGNPNNWKRSNMSEQAARAGNPAPHVVAQATFEEMARIHALYWQSPQLLDPSSKDWLRCHLWIRGQGRDTWEASQQLPRDFWKTYQQFEEQPEDNKDKLIEWDPLVRAALEKAVAGISWEAQLERLNANNSKSHWTLVHGDFWPGNVLWFVPNQEKKDDGDDGDDKNRTTTSPLKLVDWEMVGLGSGPQELGQYVISNMAQEDRKGREEHMVRAYHEVLQQNGVTLEMLSWDECWKEYTVGGVERWLWFLAYFLGQGMKDWAQFFHNQIAEFMSDHGVTANDITQPRP